MNITTTGVSSDNRSAKQDQQRHRLETKIAFIKSQIDSLPGFLPDSYQYLMQQLDQHQHQLLEILLKDEFDTFNYIESTASEH